MLFMDESGQDRHESPYEVLAGVCIDDRELWNLINRVHEAEVMFFGRRVTTGELELKGKELLKAKTFRQAARRAIDTHEARTMLAARALDRKNLISGDPERQVAVELELVALAQAKIAFVRRLLELCIQFRVKAFASIVDRDAPKSGRDFLRKDYSYMFERFFRFLENCRSEDMGIVVFDELEKSQSHMLVGQMYQYFRETAKGMHRASRVIPEPFFVHSDLTTGVQLADLVAYIISWGLRVPKMTRQARPELAALAELVKQLRYACIVTDDNDMQHTQYSFAIIDDLRARNEK